jgi:CheY-like chemotaxis protein
MDIHMPELDGVAAMREIHTLLGEQCPPIAAMTAHALAGDREHYLNAGMDDYISKPVRKADLSALLTRICSDGETPAASPFLAPVTPDTVTVPAAGYADTRVEAIPVLDTEQLEDLRYLPASSSDGDDGDPVGGLIRLFQSKGIERMALMERCLAENNWATLADTAHSLRGASASMGFPRVAILCKDLELGARQQANAATADATASAAADLAAIFVSIRHYYREADDALAVWLKEPQPAPVQAGNTP